MRRQGGRRHQGRVAVRRLTVVLGDQLSWNSAAFDGFDSAKDAVWMAEVRAESEHVPSHKARTALFLSAMRHFREALRRNGVRVEYTELAAGRLGDHLAAAVERLKPERVVVVEPGEYRVQQELKEACPRLEIVDDDHFYCSRGEFRRWAAGRKQLRLEYFYREMRRKHGVLMEGEEPCGGAWNYDAANRGSFGKRGPGLLAAPRRFEPDTITRGVLELVEREFAGHAGSLEAFDWPVTAGQAREALKDFVENRLPWFGQYQDAMWSGEPYLYHSRLSAALNLKLLDPREVIAAAVDAHRQRHAPLPAVEGFVRQVLGWREYVRGVYWLLMPDYAQRNALGATGKLPDFYWTADTEMNCLRHVIGQTLEYGFAHHIQRLMVTGLYALLLGVNPVEVHKWYLAVYVDAVEWVELPNVLGMSQYADGGVMASKPYVATGKYIQRMSNYCDGCRFKPDQATGPTACPFTTLYWDFLLRHESRLRRNQRMTMQLQNLARKSAADRAAIRAAAQRLAV